MTISSSPSSSDPGPGPGVEPFDDDTAAWFFAQSLDLFIVSDVGSIIQKVNPAWRTQFGWTAEEMVGRSLYDFVHPEDAPTLRAGGARVRELGAGEATIRVRTKDGGWRWLAGRAQLGGGGRMLATMRDVTDERAHAAEIDELRNA